MRIDQEFIKKHDIRTYAITERFSSKKNIVHKVRCIQNDGDEKTVVVKAYKGLSGGGMQKELDMLPRLSEKGLAVPEVYHVGKSAIIMEYLGGHNLLDVVCRREELAKNGESYDRQADRRLIGDFFCWLHNFYKLAKEITGRNIIFGDMNLRNFIMVSEMIYGLDFEDYCEGQPEKDAGRFCAFVLTYNPAFTNWKIGFVQEVYEVLVKRFDYGRLLIEQEMEKELGAIKKRRGSVCRPGAESGKGVFHAK